MSNYKQTIYKGSGCFSKSWIRFGPCTKYEEWVSNYKPENIMIELWDNDKLIGSSTINQEKYHSTISNGTRKDNSNDIFRVHYTLKTFSAEESIFYFTTLTRNFTTVHFIKKYKN